MRTERRRVRWWLLLAGGVFGLLIAAVVGCMAGRGLRPMSPRSLGRWSGGSRTLATSTDSPRGEYRQAVADQPCPRIGAEADLVLSGDGKGLDDFLRDTDTLAFLVVHEDRLVHERYFGGATRESPQTSFSVAKSFVSTLVGIAIDAGLIGSVDDPRDRLRPRACVA